jgi:cytochrome P450
MLAMAQVLLDPTVSLSQLVRKYGDPFSFPTTFGRMVVAVAPEGNKTILTADPDSLVPSAGDSLDFIFKKSMLLTYGEEHKRARKLLMPPFHGARMRAYGNLMRATAKRWAETWQPGKPFKMIDTTQAITLDVIIEAVFGVSGDERVQKFRQGILALFGGFSPLLFFKATRRSFFGLGPWAKFARHMETLRELVFALIAEHRATLEGREDILSLLIAARDEAGQGLSEQDIMDQLLTIVFAGHETTAVMLAWAFYFLHKNPDTLDRLRKETAALGADPEPETIVKQPYLEAVINETLRLYPPVHVAHRRTLQPMSLLGYELPAGTVVAAGIFATHRIESLYPEPEKFSPERFLSRTFSPFEFLPWGGGARRCLGAAFAMYEMKIVLYTILKEFELRLLETAPIRLEHRPGTVGPKGGIRMEMVARR